MPVGWTPGVSGEAGVVGMEIFRTTHFRMQTVSLREFSKLGNLVKPVKTLIGTIFYELSCARVAKLLAEITEVGWKLCDNLQLLRKHYGSAENTRNKNK